MTRKGTRELAYRAADGVEVLLLWPVGEHRVLVHVRDQRSDRSFELSVDADKALGLSYFERGMKLIAPDVSSTAQRTSESESNSFSRA